jgi:transposase-like protein
MLPVELQGIRTVRDMVMAFADEARCRSMLEAMVWPEGRRCPFCGSTRSGAIGGRWARPGLYQCAAPQCRKQFTVTTGTPLHSTKLPIRTWLTAMWLILQSDKGLSSPRLAEALGVSQPTAWRIGHAVRLMLAQDRPLDGIVEADISYLGGLPRHHVDDPRPGRGRKGQRRTTKASVLGLVERPLDLTPGAPAGEVRVKTVASGSNVDIGRMFETTISPDAHLLTDEAKAFMAIGTGFPAHDTVCHKERIYVRGTVHTNAADGLADRIRRTVLGVFHHISPAHADLYLGEIAWRWSQRRVTGRAVRTTRKGRSRVQTQWQRTPAVEQLPTALRFIVGRQMRRTRAGGIAIKARAAVFG